METSYANVTRLEVGSVRVRVELTFTIAMMVILSFGRISPIVTINEWVIFVIVPRLVATVCTSIKLGKESITILFWVVIPPLLPASIVKVKLSLTLAEVGVTTTFIHGSGVIVPVMVGDGVADSVGVVDLVGVLDEVGVRVAVNVKVGVAVTVSVSK